MSVVLVVEPETAHATQLRKLQKRVGAKFVVVKTTDAAIEAIDRAIPDLILLSALLLPRDERSLFAHLRQLEGASHLQTLTIPQLRTEKASGDADGKKGFSFRKKQGSAPAGCDPAVFAEELVAQLARAAELKSHSPAVSRILINEPPIITPETEPADDSAFSYQPFVPDEPVPQYQPVSEYQPVATYEPVAEPEFAPTYEPVAMDEPVATYQPVANDEPVIRADLEPPTVSEAAFIAADPGAFAAAEQRAFAAHESAIFATRKSAPVVPPAPVAPPAAPPVEVAPPAPVEKPMFTSAVPSGPSAFERLAAFFRPGFDAFKDEPAAAKEPVAAEQVAAVSEPVMAQPAAKPDTPFDPWAALSLASGDLEVEQPEASAPRQAEASIKVPELSVFDAPVQRAPDAIDDELSRLAQELGVNLDSAIVDLRNEESAERVAAEVAAVQAETEAKLAMELERVRAEAEERRLAELARLQADADATREAAIADARAAAEEETRRALASEVARVRSEAEGTVAEAVSRVKIEAEQTLSHEIGRAREDAEALRAELARAQQEAATKARALETEVQRVRANAEVHLKAEIERIGRDAEKARAADQTHAQATAERIREAAAHEARSIAEASARKTLDAEIERVRSQADTVLQAELARVRAEAQERQEVELLQLRAEMAEVREAAAEQARVAKEVREAAAEQARLAAEEARAAAEEARAASARRSAEVISFPVIESHALEEFAELEAVPALVAEEPEDAPERRDYYSLWQKIMPASEPARVEAPAVDAAEADEEYADGPDYTRWVKWGIPIAASLALVVLSGIGAVARFASPATEPAPAAVVAEVLPEREVVTPVESKFGTLKVESTPTGARITLDGEIRGKTPQTLSNLAPGTHTLVLQSSAGSMTRRVTVRAGKTTIATEAIFSGWLTLFSPIPLDVSLNGAPAPQTEDGKFMVAPGTYQVQMTNARYKFRRTETLTVNPGELTAHTVSLPTGTLRISVPDGTAVSVDNQPIGRSPFPELLPLVVGTHEIRATHPNGGERRTSVDVKFQETSEAALTF